jgi:hypothetical protein
MGAHFEGASFVVREMRLICIAMAFFITRGEACGFVFEILRIPTSLHGSSIACQLVREQRCGQSHAVEQHKVGRTGYMSIF